MKSQPERHFQYPTVIENNIWRQVSDHDPIIDGLTLNPPEKIAEILDLSANVVYLEDYRGNAAA